MKFVNFQGTKILQYCTCPAGRVTYTIFTCPANTCTCPLKALAIKNKGVICNVS